MGLTYAELTAVMPKAGGQHNFLLRGMGPRWSFVGPGIKCIDVISRSAEEVNIPARQIASAMPAGDIATADAMGAVFGSDVMARILIAGGVAGIPTSWNSLVLGASRLM